jgi:hypothetical protein
MNFGMCNLLSNAAITRMIRPRDLSCRRRETGREQTTREGSTILKWI